MANNKVLETLIFKYLHSVWPGIQGMDFANIDGLKWRDLVCVQHRKIDENG